MPAYDYKCTSCGTVSEVFHAMSESPVQRCPRCGGEMRKVPSVPMIGRGATVAVRRRDDAAKAESDMRSDLRENYGVERVVPFGGRSLPEVYNDVKGSGSFVNDRMQSESERHGKRREAARRERRRTAPSRIPKRVEAVRERAARKAAEKRRIVLG